MQELVKEIMGRICNHDVIWNMKYDYVLIPTGEFSVDDEPLALNIKSKLISPICKDCVHVYLMKKPSIYSEMVSVGLNTHGWVNRKNGRTYVAEGLVTNASNDNAGQVMVKYSRDGELYVREIHEFLTKFIPLDLANLDRFDKSHLGDKEAINTHSK